MYLGGMKLVVKYDIVIVLSMLVPPWWYMWNVGTCKESLGFIWNWEGMQRIDVAKTCP